MAEITSYYMAPEVRVYMEQAFERQGREDRRATEPYTPPEEKQYTNEQIAGFFRIWNQLNSQRALVPINAARRDIIIATPTE